MEEMALQEVVEVPTEMMQITEKEETVVLVLGELVKQHQLHQVMLVEMVV